MSFSDFGYEIFPYSQIQKENTLQILLSNKCFSSKKLLDDPVILQNSCCYVIIEHLIDLGTNTERELRIISDELEKYKKLDLTPGQIKQLERFRQEYVENIGYNRTIFRVNLDKKNSYYRNEYAEKVSDFGINALEYNSDDIPSSKKHVTNNSLSHAEFRAIIIEKDSEIISLKNENAAKDTELRELEDQIKSLENLIDKSKDDIELLEESSRISQLQIEECVKLKNKELEITRQNYDRLVKELKDERVAREIDEQEITKLQSAFREIQISRKNLADELKMMRRKMEAIESSNATQNAMLKQLQKEKDSLDQENCNQENEIEKLLAIIGRLEEKYNTIKVDLTRAKEEITERERLLNESKNQMEIMEREVNKLISNLADCLVEADSQQQICGSRNFENEQDMYSQARKFAKGLIGIVRQHGNCRKDKVYLPREIYRRKSLNRGEVEEINNEINHNHIKKDLKGILDDLLQRIDSRKFERTEQTYIRVASEASLALEKLDKKINDHEVYRRCENFLLLELENLQEALDGAEKTINGLDLNLNFSDNDENSPFKHFEEKRRKLFGENYSYSIIENVFSKQLLQRVQNSTRIVIRITTALRDDSVLKVTYNKKLEEQLQEALATINEIGTEKCKLQNEYNECKSQCKELISEIERLKSISDDRSKELLSLNDELKSKLELSNKEIDTLRKQLLYVDKLYQQTKSEKSSLKKNSEDTIISLQRELKAKDMKIDEYGKFNDFLNSKLEESSEMVEKLQNALVEESIREVDLYNTTILQNRVLELDKEKSETKEKLSVLQSHLDKYERENSKLQRELDKILNDNKDLEKNIFYYKNENEKEKIRMNKAKENEIDLRTKFDELVGRIAKISRCAKPCRDMSVVQGLMKEIQDYKDKMSLQEKVLKESKKAIDEKTKKIEVLNTLISKAKQENPLTKRVEILSREKIELENELEQTRARYEDKLSEMHKQYKHNEIELLKTHKEKIRQLEANYDQMNKNDGNLFDVQAWIETLNPSEVQNLHDRICKTPLCSSSTYTKNFLDQQVKRTSSKSTIVSSYGSKKSVQPKKDVKNLENSSATKSKPNSRQRITSVRDSLSNHSIHVPERDLSHGIGNVRSNPITRSK